MIKAASSEVAERNAQGFNAALRALKERKGGGLEWYEIRGSSIFEYDPLSGEIYRSIDMHGYRAHSLCAKCPLTDEEQADLEQEISLGLVDIFIVSNIVALSARRVWHGEYNMPAPKRRWDEATCRWTFA